MKQRRTSPPAVAVAEASQPYPPRYRWLKRLSLLGLAVLVCCAGLRVWWAAYARRVFDADVAARQARGERLFPADFEPDPPADVDNAVYYIQRSFPLISNTAIVPAASNYSYRDYLPLPKFWVKMASRAVA